MIYKKPFLFIFACILLLSLIYNVQTAFAKKDITNDVFFLYDPLEATVPVGGSSNKSSLNSVTAEAVIVIDADTGQILFAKNPHQKRPIASTTKIMTALLAIECGDLKDIVTVSKRAAGVEGSSVYLRTGEKLSLEELLYGALLKSGNDACVAIAEHIAGREQIFVDWMNYKAFLIGAQNTHFSNTNGLPHKEHLSSAYDLAIISRYALNNPTFNQMVATKNQTISGPNGQRQLKNTNKMLWSYQWADGIKTGTTYAAGRCLVTSATKDGRRLIAVVLHSHNRYSDSTKLLNYCFANYKKETIIRRSDNLSSLIVSNGTSTNVPIGIPHDLIVSIPLEKKEVEQKIVLIEPEISAPVKAGMTVGKLLILIDGDPVLETKLITKKNVDEMPMLSSIYKRVLSF